MVKRTAVAAIAVLGVAVLYFAAPAKALDASGTLTAHRIEGTPYLEEGYATEEMWQEDYDAALSAVKESLTAIGEIEEYIPSDIRAELDNFSPDNFIYIKDLEEYDAELQRIKNEALAAKERQLERQRQAQQASSNIDLRSAGIVNWGGYRFTWYSQNVLPGGGLSIPGRHVNGSGFVCDGDGYIVAATAMGRGTVGNSPWGQWKSYDTGVSGNTVDLYTNW